MGQAGPSNGYAPPLYASVPNPYALNATPYPAQPPQVPFIPPTAMIETPPAAQSQYLQTKIRPKNSLRAASTPLPLKSALKKTGAAGATPGPAIPMQLAEQGVLPRRPRNSKVKHDQFAATALPVQTVESLAKEEPYHMFVTFKGDSELLLENTLENARKEIERKIFPMWPHGVETQFRGSDWILRFRNAPWNMNGPDVVVAWELISALFTLFTERGFKFMASTKCTTAQPRLIFQSTHADRSSAFFLAYLSRGGRRVSLIDPPHHIAAAFGPRLRAFLPNQVDVSNDGNIHIVETKREIGTTVRAVKASYFLMQILKVLMDMEFHLHATVPMARGGPLGLGSRRELLVFKGVLPQ
ncbi:hypothetical protein DFH08DRAFT_689338 [Mycena albidolilacea]|uniref:Uncharacterized protein n=1 Tax=Mycena albidolilacea TaxID=1033008 RepID=A0AAD7AH34_9AGAR|nr:hypothetical protein DFH08DRAFT_689338 [Mycena albidolilacea]